MSREVMQQALEALDSDNPDIQLRAAIALRKALETEPEPMAAAEREACAQIAQDWDASHLETNYGACIANVIRARGSDPIDL